MDFEQLELGPKMQACGERERKFVWYYLLGDEDGRLNATDAARKAGYVDSDNGAIRRRGHQLMHRERVMAAIEEVGRKEFRALLIPAIMSARALLNDPKHPDHSRTALSVLSRLGFAEKTGVDVNVTGELTVNHTDEALAQLRQLRDMGVPREKLIEVFGFSGLSRYEKMLAVTDARKPIEAEYQEVKGDG